MMSPPPVYPWKQQCCCSLVAATSVLQLCKCSNNLIADRLKILIKYTSWKTQHTIQQPPYHPLYTIIIIIIIIIIDINNESLNCIHLRIAIRHLHCCK